MKYLLNDDMHYAIDFIVEVFDEDYDENRLFRKIDRIINKLKEEKTVTKEDIEEIINEEKMFAKMAFEDGFMSKEQYEKELQKAENYELAKEKAELIDEDIILQAIGACELVNALVCSPTQSFLILLESFRKIGVKRKFKEAKESNKFNPNKLKYFKNEFLKYLISKLYDDKVIHKSLGIPKELKDKWIEAVEDLEIRMKNCI